MKQILKKDLLNLIAESNVEMGELAYKAKGTQDSGGRIRKFVPIFKDDNNTDIPDGWYVNPNQVEGEEKAYFFLEGQELDVFTESNREFLDSIANKIGQDRVCLQDGNRTKCQPRSIKTGAQYVPTGNKMPSETKIKRELNSLVEEYMASPEVSEKLSKLSIPEIRARDRADTAPACRSPPSLSRRPVRRVSSRRRAPAGRASARRRSRGRSSYP